MAAETPAQRDLEESIGSRWPVLFGVWLVYFCFGVITASMAPLVAPIRAELGISTGTMGLILGAWPVTYILFAIPCGMLLDHIGARRMLALSAVLMAVSALARGFADTPLMLGLAVALFGVGGPMISVGAPMVITRLYEGQARSTAMGLYVTGPYLGGLTALAITNSLVMPLVGQEWRAVMMVYAGAVLFSGLVWYLLSARMGRRGAGADAKKYDPAAFLEIAALRKVQILLAISVGIFFINHGFNNWMPEILRSRGFSAVAAGYWAAIPPAIGILGVLVIPRLATPARRLKMMAGLFVSVFLASLLLQTGSRELLAGGLMLQGLARGSMMTLAIMILMDLPGIPQDRLGLAGGLFFTAAEVGGVLGPVAFGLLAPLAEGFVVPLAAVSVLCVGLLVLLVRLQNPTT
ncbi:MAG: MFS transporter [Rhodobacteraceae bacterium]|nr:MFS transporter [Paracoccaceae bacterium]